MMKTPENRKAFRFGAVMPCLLAAMVLLFAIALPGTTRANAYDGSFSYPDHAVVGFLGPMGTFSHEAATIIPGNDVTFAEGASVSDVLTALDNGECSFAVVPVENTIGGLTGNGGLYIDLLLSRSDIAVVCEVNLPIRQTLIGLPGTDLKDIKTVYSHSQGLTQGKEWMDANIPGVETVVVDSTAEGVRIVSQLQDPTCAAIAAPAAAGVFGLDILAENIQIITTNVTRFYVVTKDVPENGAGDRALISVICQADNLPAFLNRINEAGCSLISIHEKPAKTKLGEYRYIIELSSVTEEAIGKWMNPQEDAPIELLGVFGAVNP